MNWFRRLRAFGADRRGGYTTTFALLAPVFLGGIAGLVDFQSYNSQRSAMQEAADIAALSAAKEGTLYDRDISGVQAVADASARAAYGTFHLSDQYYEVNASTSNDGSSVTVEIEQDHYPYFFAAAFPSPQIAVSATAVLTGQTNTCIIVKSADKNAAFEMSGDASVKAEECAAYSNSVHEQGIKGKQNAVLTTDFTCSVGGYAGNPAQFQPEPLTDCPAMSDPLADRAKLLDAKYGSSSCDHTDAKMKGGVAVLSPGTYCGKLEATDGAIVYLKPGVYVLKDAKVKVDKDAVIIGKEVGLAFFGENSKLELKNKTTIALSAPKDGPMAGILIYARPEKKSREFKIESNDAKRLVGTVYLPGDRLKVGGDADGDGLCDFDPAIDDISTFVSEVCETNVGKMSAWTAIVVDELKVTNGVQLDINSDYDSSPIPVPAGLGPTTGETRLLK